MKKTIITIASILGLVLIIFSTYNNLVKLDQNVELAWSNIQTQYQARLDVYASQTDIIKGASQNDKDILLEITKLRSGISTAKENVANAQTPQEIQAEMSKVQGQFNITVENYPEIKSTEAFLKFQDIAEGTERRISTARDDFNKHIKNYNQKIKSLPTLLYAGLLGFDEKEAFNSDKGADKRPEINF